MSLEEQILELATELGVTVAVAESTAGGLICSALVGVPGSSKYFERGIIAYSKQSKIELLGLSEEFLRENGAVSAATVEAMACGVLRNAGTDIGVAESGIAGPIRGRSPKPVGTTYISVCSKDGCETSEHVFAGDRAEIRRAIAHAALEELCRCLTKRAQKIESPPA